MIKGQCLCGKVQYIYHGDLEKSILCYCKHCQLAQGSFAAWNSPIPLENFELISGEDVLKSYFHTELKARVFCGECGSPLYSHRLDLPGVIRLRLGSVVEGKIPPPYEEFFQEYKPNFIETIHS